MDAKLYTLERDRTLILVPVKKKLFEKNYFSTELGKTTDLLFSSSDRSSSASLIPDLRMAHNQGESSSEMKMHMLLMW